LRADDFELQLKDMKASYEVVKKEMSQVLFLIESGVVIREERIQQYLTNYSKELTEKMVIPSDSREIG
jgi:hypothetical protein